MNMKTRAQFLTVLTAVLVLGAGAIIATVLLTQPKAVNMAATQYYTDQPTLGVEDAPVTLILFENFLCEHCRTFEEEVFPALKRDFIDTGQVQAVYLNLAWGEEPALLAGLAGECVYRQSNTAFWAYKTRLFEEQGSWTTAADLVAHAEGVANLDTNALATCIGERQTQSDLERDLAAAESIGVSGTPSVVIGTQGFEAPDYETLRRAIEAELENQARASDARVSGS
jgi:protein-disulfide isomerase